ncbi:helix-turn-helix domain-containing protein [Ancylobacter sp.]|uniref:helix-turn-helix domain-containing protein n=1 Tax=Ancylobacter sp. TaxID=1872567 RepID=UPI003C7D6925
MPIKVSLAAVLARRNVKSKDLAASIGITEANLSLLRQGKVKGIRFDTLQAICRALDCQPGDILHYEADDDITAAPSRPETDGS